MDIKNFFSNIIKDEGNKTLLENFTSLSVLQVANYILPFIVFVYVIRVLGPEKFGLISFATAFIGYFQILTDYGFNYSATREIAIYQNDKEKLSNFFSSVMSIKLILGGICFLGLSLILYIFPQLRVNSILYFITFGMVIGNILFPVWFFQGIEKMKYITILNVFSKVISTILIFIFVKQISDYLYVPLLNSMGFIVGGIIGFIVVIKVFNIGLVRPSKDMLIHELKEGWHVFISTVSVSLYTNTRIFAVGLFTNNTITGYYTIAEKLMEIVQTFPLASLTQSLFPRLSKIHSKNPKKAYKIAQKFQKYTVIFFLLLIPILWVLAPWIVDIVAGEPYEDTILAFRILLIAVFFINANAFKIFYLLIGGKGELYAKIHVLMGIFGCFLTFLAVYILGYIGAAITILLIAIFVLVLTNYYLKEEENG